MKATLAKAFFELAPIGLRYLIEMIKAKFMPKIIRKKYELMKKITDEVLQSLFELASKIEDEENPDKKELKKMGLELGVNFIESLILMLNEAVKTLKPLTK